MPDDKTDTPDTSETDDTQHEGDTEQDDTDKNDTDDGGPDPAVVEAEEKAAAARKEAAQRRRELKPWKDLAREFEVTPEQVRERLSGKAAEIAEVDADKIRREASREATQGANQRILRAEVKALAADLFADPGDAPLFVDLSAHEVDEDGAVDEDAILDDLRGVLDRKPHLAKANGQQKTEPRTPKPDPSQGSGRGPAPTGAEKGLAEAQRRFGVKQTT